MSENYKKCFYQKHIAHKTSDALHGVIIQEKNKSDEYIYINDVAGLLAFVQMSVLELHPWGSRIDHVDNPDMITFDLDPAPRVPWKKS